MRDTAAVAVPEGFEPHPEGGSYRETWRSKTRIPRARDAVTAIAFHLEPGERSRWHRVHKADELWVWNGGGRLRLRLGGTGAAPALDVEVVLGPGDQHLVARDEWQSAEPVRQAVTAACVVSPGFDFADLELWADPEPPDAAVSVLLICEGNLCRSPTAELLLRRELQERSISAVVRSAGLRTEAGLPMEGHAVAALQQIAPVDPSGFRSTQFEDADADLVLTATVAQRDKVVEAVPSALDRTFAWLELLALADQSPVEARSLGELVVELRARRGSVRGDFDVSDPIGRPAKVFDRTARSIADAMERLAEVLASVR